MQSCMISDVTLTLVVTSHIQSMAGICIHQMISARATPKLCKHQSKSIQHHFLEQAYTRQFNITIYRLARAFSSSCVNWTGQSRFRKPQHVPKAAKMSWMDSWSRPSKHQATPAPYYLLPGGEDTPYCKTCGRVIGELFKSPQFQLLG
jgi:hypothetical protein